MIKMHNIHILTSICLEMFGKLLHHMLLYMLECTTLHKAEEKPTLSSLRQGGLRYVAVQSGKSCQRSARKSRAASKHMYLCCALMMRRTRRLTADRIHPLHGNVYVYDGRGAAGSLRQLV